MDNTTERGASKVQQFKDISEEDQRLLNRLVVDRNTPRTPKKHVDVTVLNNVFRRTLQNASDIRNIFKVMPDLNLPRNMLVSAICAPGDLATTSLIMTSGMGGGSNPLTAALIDALEQFHIKEQKLPTKVPGWVDDAKIMSGAHPIMIIPEASIDRMLHGGLQGASLESVASYGGEKANGWFKPKGILGLRVPASQRDDFISLESAFDRISHDRMVEYHTIKVTDKKPKTINLPMMVTDNMASLRTPAVQQVKRAGMMERAYGTPSLESRRRERLQKEGKDGKEISNAEVYARFFKPPQGAKRSRLEVVPTLKQAGGKTFGHPLVYHLPIESVIPVCVPGDETNHVGYIVILDQNGYPVSYSRRLNYYEDVRRGASGIGDSNAIAGELIQMSGETMAGGIGKAQDHQLDRLAELHGDVIDADLLARLKTGMMSGDFELARTDHVDRLLFSRTMKNQMTTLLYVPAELMIYFAFEYNEFGIGKSILEDAKALAAMRAALTVANVIGSARAAIPGKNVNIKLDESDGDPLGTATFMANEAMALNYQEFPMSVSTPQGMAEKMQQSGFTFNITGNPRFPDVETSVTERENTFTPVNQEIINQLRDDLTRVFDLTPEMVDGSNQPDFATTVVQNSLMLLKRVMADQEIANPQISDYVRIFTMNSGILIDQLMDIIGHNTKFLPDEYKENPEEYLEDFLNALNVNLPSPENESMKKQIEDINEYSAALDAIIPVAYLRDEFLDGYSTELQREALPTLIAAWKGVEMRRYMRDRGLFQHLDIFGNNEDGSPMMDMLKEMSTFVESMVATFGEYSKKAATDALARKRANEALRELDEKAKAALESPPVDPTAEDTSATGSDELGNDSTGQDDLTADTTDADNADANAETPADDTTDTDAPPDEPTTDSPPDETTGDDDLDIPPAPAL